jgi:hypothetical protein
MVRVAGWHAGDPGLTLSRGSLYHIRHFEYALT